MSAGAGVSVRCSALDRTGCRPGLDCCHRCCCPQLRISRQRQRRLARQRGTQNQATPRTGSCSADSRPGLQTRPADPASPGTLDCSTAAPPEPYCRSRARLKLRLSPEASDISTTIMRECGECVICYWPGSWENREQLGCCRTARTSPYWWTLAGSLLLHTLLRQDTTPVLHNYNATQTHTVDCW